MELTRIYSDGSCYPNPGPGGWAAMVVDGGPTRYATGGELGSTNNRMELMGAIGGLCLTQEGSDVEVYSDSQYVTNAYLQGWMRKWKAEGKFGTDRLKNNELWEALDLLVKARKVKWFWVRGHNGHAQNEKVDALAGEARRRWEAGERW